MMLNIDDFIKLNSVKSITNLSNNNLGVILTYLPYNNGIHREIVDFIPKIKKCIIYDDVNHISNVLNATLYQISNPTSYVQSFGCVLENISDKLKNCLDFKRREMSAYIYPNGINSGLVIVTQDKIQLRNDKLKKLIINIDDIQKYN